MNAVTESKAKRGANDFDQVRIDYVPASHFTSPEFLKLEQEKLWTRVWQVACREEEVPKVGSFMTYNIMDESIVVVRTSETELKAFYNVCQHRGRRLVEGDGQINHFQCRYHGWQYNLDGTVKRVLDRDDWAGCPNFGDDDLNLAPLQVGTWAGFVFVNPDPKAEPLEKFLGEAPSYLDPIEMQKMRYRWYASVKVPCNWKVGLGAFIEAYHAFATHSQWMHFFGDDTTRTRIHGKHSMFYYPPNPEHPMGAPSPRTGKPAPTDFRRAIVDYLIEFDRTLHAYFSERDVEASHRVLTELPPDASAYEVIGKAMEFQREAAIAAGVGWPDITMEQFAAASIDWHIFPHLIILPYLDATLAYRALPHPTDPNACYFEVYSLQRYAPGNEPALVRQYLHGDDDWRKFKDISVILQQDFDNMGEVQKGMKSKGFRGARTNPLQESTVSHFHRTLVDFITAE